MANSTVDTIPGRFEVKATASDHFSWLRARLSVGRTMMSWVRTATALIGFGFTIMARVDVRSGAPISSARLRNRAGQSFPRP
jgi:putative membrane protein